VIDIAVEISPVELKALLDAGTPLRLVDVREPQEEQLCRIDGAELIPMNTIPGQLQDLKAGASPLVVFCHHGVRSLHVVEWLRKQGIDHVRSMAGGIDRWSREIDSSVPRY
jgi:rhodanese-related sulfurtransferase